MRCRLVVGHITPWFLSLLSNAPNVERVAPVWKHSVYFLLIRNESTFHGIDTLDFFATHAGIASGGSPASHDRMTPLIHLAGVRVRHLKTRRATPPGFSSPAKASLARVFTPCAR